MVPLEACDAGFLASIGKRDELKWPQAHLPFATGNPIAEDPRSGAARRDLKIEAATVGISASAAQLPDGHGRESVIGTRHR